MKYSDDDKALIMLSYETSYNKKRDAVNGVGSPKELYRDYSHADVVIAEMNKKGIVAVTQDSEYYPSALKEIYDPPQVLYCKGDHITRPRSKRYTTRRRCFTAKETFLFLMTGQRG